MGSYFTEARIGQHLEALDDAIARKDGLAANYHVEEVNRLAAPLRNLPTRTGLQSQLPGWLGKIIVNRGLRIPALEEAIGAQRVVVSGRVGSRKMIELKVTF